MMQFALAPQISSSTNSQKKCLSLLINKFVTLLVSMCKLSFECSVNVALLFMNVKKVRLLGLVML